jgi:hypothetical protein
MSAFTVIATDGAARAGILSTAHGDVPTPAFMPVGTKGTVKSVHPDELTALGAPMILGNTYHLHFRPGDDVIAELGGLHAFCGWSGPILTDSGGFQVFSLRDTLLAVDDDGVTFRSVYDGGEARFTPELVAGIQSNLGSDVAMCLDICPPACVSRAELEEAVRRTTLWAARQREAERDRAHLGLRACQRHLRFQARPGVEVTAIAKFSWIFVRPKRMGGDIPRRRNPDFAVVVRRKIVRHHSDDGELVAIKHQVTSDHVAIGAVTARPKSLAEQRDVGVSRLGIFRAESSPEHWLCPEEQKELGRGHCRANAFRLLAAGEIRLPPARCSHRREDGILRRPIDKVRGRSVLG